MYAERDIKKYEEILFDYDGKDELCNQYNWINDFSDNKKKYKEGSLPYHPSKYAKNSCNSQKFLLNKRTREGETNKATTISNSQSESFLDDNSIELRNEETQPCYNI